MSHRPTGSPRLHRAVAGRLVGGVAAGLAEHLRLPVVAVRLGFVALTVVSGLGAVLYAAYWAVVPVDPAGNRTASTPQDTVQLVAFGSLALGIQLIAVLTGFGGVTVTFGWLVALVALGAGIIWHQADPVRRRQWTGMGPGSPRLATYLGGHRYAMGVRLGGGAVLVLVGIVGMVAVFSPLSHASLSSLLNGLGFTAIAIGGLGVVFGPLLWGMVRQLRAEREATIAARERADVASLIHDQVLHTLALIQRNAGDQREVSRLARSQERSLRNWLYAPAGSPSERLAAALEQASGEVENAYAVTVDTVVVGDRTVDGPVAALVAAAREALVNAARHSGMGTVSLYAEVEPDQVSVFVRDRGTGFDLAAVDADRHGVRGSVIDRMRRHGGRAEIRTAPGAGTEVRLYLPVEAEEAGHERT